MTERKNSILFIGNFLSSTLGIATPCEEISRRLVLGGWQVFTASAKMGRLARVADMLLTAWRHRRLYNLAHVDVYSGQAFMWAEAATWLLRWLGKPYVLSLHGGNLPTFAHCWPGRMRRRLRGAAAVTTPSNYLLEEMRLYRGDMHLIPNGLHLEAYHFRERRQAGPKLVWLRSFHRMYNPSLAVRVLAQLTGEFPQVHLTMIGPDKGDCSLQETQDLARKLRVESYMAWPGRVAKAAVPDLLDRGDIFLNTTYVDNAPVTVTEAMACGMCVVSTKVGGIPYLLTDGEDALLVPPNDPEAMAAAVRRILAEPKLAARLSNNARKKVETFDWGNIITQWVRLLSSINSRSSEDNLKN